MSNIVPIGLPKKPSLGQRQASLLRNFAAHRRSQTDVFWLKENAEILNILANGAACLPPNSLDVYRAFYDTIEERIRFFPQYYRFLLSICLDLEDLGLEGDKGRALCGWVDRTDLVAGELSDLQRAEAERLVCRRLDRPAKPGLRGRLNAFIAHSETFALPNKKASYELTHIVFYLSDYGRNPLALDKAALTSLEYAGLLAYLDQDLDLLSEVCVAMRFAGHTPSAVWETWLEQQLTTFFAEPAADGPKTDAYHEYLVSGWWASVAGHEGFLGAPAMGSVEFARHNARPGPLRVLSETMFEMGPARSGDWDRMRPLLAHRLDSQDHEILAGAESSTSRFEAFFEEFARAGG